MSLTHTVGVAIGESYRLRADARLETGDGGALVLRQSRFQLTLDQLGVSRRALVLRLAEGWVDEDEMNRLVAGIEGEGRILRAQVLVRRLVAHSWLRRRVLAGGRPLVEVVPEGLGPHSLPPEVRHQPGTTYRLSRFVRLGADGGHLSARTPLCTVSVGCVDPPVASLLARSASDGCDPATVASHLGVDDAVAGRLLDELLTAGILVPAAEHEAERSAPPGAYWDPAELEVHHRSRVGRHVHPVGGTNRFQGRLSPEPLHQTFPGARSVRLATPDLDRIASAERSLTDVIRSRRSIRTHDDSRPITLGQLAEFLYRVQFTRAVTTVDGHETGRRPYPAGGAICELEVYPLLTRCAGAAAGLYHYDSVAHELRLLAGPGPAADRMVAYARAAAAMPAPPQVVLVIAARADRLMWKYEGMGYSMMLKDAGVLTELMYLVATSMELAPCALGAGESAAFAELTGLDPLVQPSIADFLLGTPGRD